jgi:iron(III) transport system substrate-binding protein
MSAGRSPRRWGIVITLGALCAVAVASVSAATAAAPPKINPIFAYNKADRTQHLYGCAKQEGSVTLYTSTSAMDPTLKPAFQSQFPGVKLNTYIATAQLVPKLRQEEQAGQHVFDVYNDAMGNLSRNSTYFQPFWSPAMAQVQKGLASPYFVASNGYLFNGLYYNPNLVSAGDVPKTYQDLLKPQYTGKIYMGTDTQAQIMAGLLGYVFGRQYYLKLADQVRVLNTSGRGVADQVIAGTIPMGIELSSSYYKRDYLNNGAPLRLQVMNPMFGTFQASSISKYTTHPCASMLLVDWLSSRASTGASPIFATLGNALPWKDANPIPFDIAGQLPQNKWKIYYQNDRDIQKKLGFKNWTQLYAYWSKQYLQHFVNG